MKKYLLLTLTALLLVAGFSGSALAKERLFTFSNNNNGAVKEVNYYLDNGAKVVFMDTAAKATDSTVIITVVLDIPGRCASISKVNSKRVPQALAKGDGISRLFWY